VFETGTCDECRKTGFRGRGGIFEVLTVSESIRSLVIAHSPMSEIKQKGIAEGMRTLRDDGWEKVLGGVTTIDEVLRVTEENE
jgi:general secretion pathway protein E